MLEFTVPNGVAGSTMGRLTEMALVSLKPSLDKHYSGEERLWPDNPFLCNEMCDLLWKKIYSLRDQAAFLLSDLVENKMDPQIDSEGPLYEVTKCAIMLELIDKEVGQNSGGVVEIVWDYVWTAPMLRHIPHRRTRVYH